MMLESIDYWHGSVEVRSVRQILNNLHFVADTYGLIIHEDDEKRAIASITALLTLWTAAEFGVRQVYGPREVKKRRKRR